MIESLDIFFNHLEDSSVQYNYIIHIMSVLFITDTKVNFDFVKLSESEYQNN